MPRFLLRVFLVLFLFSVAAAAQTPLSGVVKDESGGVIAGATVLVRNESAVEQQTVSGPEGRFTLKNAPSSGSQLVVRAVGFAEWTQPVQSGDLEVVLQTAALSDSITVTPSRTEQRLGDVPASVSVVSRERIQESPAVVVDDVLRLVPTFSLFRRTSSLSSHPTTQGVSLRGVGPSGVSRSLVLIDGVPFNDPFGGWVYWTRVPLDSVDRIEVVDGTSSSVYGSYALGGVINVVSARPQPRTVEFRTQFGNKDTRKGDFFASDVWGKVGASVEGSFFSTDGFPIVIENERGPVDTQATVDYHNFNLKLDYSHGESLSFFFRGGYFREERNNAKVSTFDGSPEENSTLWKSASGGIRWILPDQSDLQARVFTDFETFHSSFLAVPNLTTRAIGRMSLLQRVPTRGAGGMVQWSTPVLGRHLFTAGFDGRWVDGASHEQALDQQTGQTVTLVRESGGTQTSMGVYLQGQFWLAPRVSLNAGGRLDRWRNYDARNLETTVATGQPTAASGLLPERDDTVFSPRAAVLFHVSEKVTAWGSLGSGFRAPTLNELYRQFRVGAILTLANADLGPERLVGGEVGVNVAPMRDLTVRTTWFDNRVENPVSNVTIATNTRQRQNLGRTRIWGVQSDVEYRLSAVWRVGAGYMYNQAKVTEFEATPELVGNFLPQVPEHRGSLSVTYSNPRVVSASVNGLFFGHQFDDDQNTAARPGNFAPGLPAYATLEMMISRALGQHADVFFGVQNLFDEEYYVGLAPTTIGSPRLMHGGIRVRFSGR